MEEDLLAYTAGFARALVQCVFNNPIERFNRELKRRTDVAQIFPKRPLRDPARRRPARGDQR